MGKGGKGEMREGKGERKGRGWRMKEGEEPALSMKKSFLRSWWSFASLSDSLCISLSE